MPKKAKSHRPRRKKPPSRPPPWVPKLGDYVTILEVPPQDHLDDPNTRSDQYVGKTYFLGDDDYPPRWHEEDEPYGDWKDCRPCDYVQIAPTGCEYVFSARVRRATPEEEAACRLGG